MAAPNEDSDRVNLARAARNLLENLPALIDFEKAQVQLTRARFLALVESGFTEQQALELCKKP